MAWVYLLIAATFEIGWAVGLKYSHGWTRPVPSVITAILMIASYAFLSLAVRTLQIGTAYAIWTGIGAAGTALFGILLFGEPSHAPRLLFILLIVVGIVGLKMTSP